ncbi:MAG: type IV toxin-antitoxin system AbiEi family antitoxin domain-containing protein [Microbacteriaceae bacterium]
MLGCLAAGLPGRWAAQSRTARGQGARNSCAKCVCGLNLIRSGRPGSPPQEFWTMDSASAERDAPVSGILRRMKNTVIATRADLLASGWTARRITEAVRSGTIIRLRNGIYTAPDCDPDVAIAVRIGGVLGCVSALAALGVWTRSRGPVHVQLDGRASRIRRGPHGTVLHWRTAPLPCSPIAAHPIDALVDACHCLPFELAVAGVDSALNLGLISRGDLEALLAALPRRLRRVVERADGRCMSGTETILRLALEDAGIPFEPQVRIPGVGTVDFVVAGCIIVEVDSHAWHDSDEAKARDYERDLAAARAGYAVLRLRYEHVMFEIDACLSAVRSLVALVQNS